uniref:Uncharacterized protein n=1 Tax=Pyxicephalus adspersus TaxID=30357 RepID=A0AAV2ZQ14_PYXAD|nr:TPA: hypothetical protein GDO54_017221 [Pyxicephalus adspersus]
MYENQHHRRIISTTLISVYAFYFHHQLKLAIHYTICLYRFSKPMYEGDKSKKSIYLVSNQSSLCTAYLMVDLKKVVQSLYSVLAYRQTTWLCILSALKVLKMVKPGSIKGAGYMQCWNHQ